MNRLNRKRLTFLSLSLAVPVILLCVFVVYPFWELIHMSFLEWEFPRYGPLQGLAITHSSFSNPRNSGRLSATI